jgi:hypothetical protein
MDALELGGDGACYLILLAKSQLEKARRRRRNKPAAGVLPICNRAVRASPSFGHDIWTLYVPIAVG